MFRPWEFLVSLPVVVLVAVLFLQRSDVFRAARYGAHAGDALPLLLWALGGTALLLGTKPWKSVSRKGSQVRLLTLALGLASTLFLLVLGSDRGRAAVISFETRHYDMGLSQTHDTSLGLALLDPMIGRYLLADKSLQDHLIRRQGEVFLQAPRSASVLWSAAVLDGAPDLLEQTLRSETGGLFMLSVLSYSPDRLTDIQARSVVAPFLKRLRELDRPTMECLLMAVALRPSLLQKSEREAVLLRWAQSFQVHQDLVAEGLMIRERLQAFLGTEHPLRVKITVQGLGPSGYYYQDLPMVIPRLISVLIGSCGVSTELVKEKADLQVTVDLGEVAHHEYQKPQYGWKSYYRDRQLPSAQRFGYRTQRVKEDRQVIVGYSKEVESAPTLGVVFELQGRKLELQNSLLFWHHGLYDHEKNRYLDLNQESSYGRMWPIGLPKWRFESMEAN